MYPLDGIDQNGLRKQWDSFYINRAPEGLVEELTRQARQSQMIGSVLSLPSNAIIDHELLKFSEKYGLITILPFGEQEDCLKAFLERERETNLGKQHWIQNNLRSYLEFSSAKYDRFRISTFVNSKRVPRNKLIGEIKKRLSKSAKI
jgi:hypothetical protein